MDIMDLHYITGILLHYHNLIKLAHFCYVTGTPLLEVMGF